MPTLSKIAILIPPILAAIYTWNYARWAWRSGEIRGAVGLAFLAVLTLIVPGFMLWWRS